MSRLSRHMERAYQRGLADGRQGRRRDPAHFGEPGYPWSRQLRWAYDAGHAEGLREFRELAGNIEQMTQGPGERR